MKLTVKVTTVAEVTNCYNCPMSVDIKDFFDFQGLPFKRCSLAPSDHKDGGVYGGGKSWIPHECPLKTESLITVTESTNNLNMSKVIEVIG